MTFARSAFLSFSSAAFFSDCAFSAVSCVICFSSAVLSAARAASSFSAVHSVCHCQHYRPQSVPQCLFFCITLFQLLFQRIQLLNHFCHICILLFSCAILFQPVPALRSAGDLLGQRRFISGQCGQFFAAARSAAGYRWFSAVIQARYAVFRRTCFQLFSSSATCAVVFCISAVFAFSSSVFLAEVLLLSAVSAVICFPVLLFCRQPVERFFSSALCFALLLPCSASCAASASFSVSLCFSLLSVAVSCCVSFARSAFYCRAARGSRQPALL